MTVVKSGRNAIVMTRDDRCQLISPSIAHSSETSVSFLNLMAQNFRYWGRPSKVRGYFHRASRPGVQYIFFRFQGAPSSR